MSSDRFYDDRPNPYYRSDVAFYRKGFARVLGPHAVAVYHYLCCCSNTADLAWPGLTAICETVGISRTCAVKCITMLEEHHLITVERHAKRTNIYRLTSSTEWVIESTRTTSSPELLVNGVVQDYQIESTRTTQTSSPGLLKLEAGELEAGELEQRERLKREIPKNHEPESFQEVLRRETRKPRTSQHPPELKKFQQFMTMYPLKVDEAGAERVWRSLSNDDRDAALAGIQRQRDWPSMTGDPRYIPHPRNWLQNKRWTDQPAKPRERDSSGKLRPEYGFPDWWEGGWRHVDECRAYLVMGKQLPERWVTLLTEVNALEGWTVNDDR